MRQVPIVIRGPGGVGRQLGAEHSQRLESYFQSIPGVQLVACSTVANAKALLKSAIRSDNPIIFFEHVLLYNVKGEHASTQRSKTILFHPHWSERAREFQPATGKQAACSSSAAEVRFLSYQERNGMGAGSAFPPTEGDCAVTRWWKTSCHVTRPWYAGDTVDDYYQPLEKAEMVRQGKDVTILCYSRMRYVVMQALQQLEPQGYDPEASSPHG